MHCPVRGTREDFAGSLCRRGRRLIIGTVAVSWWSYRDRLALGAAVVAPFGVAAALVPLRASFPNTDAALVLVAVIVAIAANGHRIAGLVAAASSAVWFDFLLTRPYGRFTITSRGDIETTALLLLVGAAVTELAVRGRRHQVLAATDEAYLAAIRSTTDLVGSAAAPKEVIDHVTAQLTTLLDAHDCRFEGNRFGGLPRLRDDGLLNGPGGPRDLDQDGMPDSPFEITASSNNIAYGRFVVEPTAGAMVPLAARQVAVILVSHVGLALAGQARSGRS